MQFLDQFIFPQGKLVVAVEHPSNLRAYKPGTDLPTDKSVFFGPALRKDVTGEKESVIGTVALWVDVDAQELPRTTYPPTSVVWSGRGWHMYWLLDDPLLDIERIETYNQALLHDTNGADPGSWNANRVLRVPGTINKKYDPPAQVQLRSNNGVRYHISDFEVLGTLKRKTRHKIQTGDRRGYRSRSERDWAVICDLIAAGATDKLILQLFEKQAIGDKYRDLTTPKQYLPHTISKARSKTTRSKEGEWIEGDDGYYIPTRDGARRVSTFVISPRVLLDGAVFGEEDAIVGDVSAAGYTWTDVTFPRASFTSIRQMDKACPVAAWQFLGRDTDVRKLLPYLMEQLQDVGLPRIAATPTLGLHKIGGEYLFLGDKQVLNQDTQWTGFDGPLAWLPTGREHPELDLEPNMTDDERESLAELVPLLNESGIIWPMLGWYAATPLKPWLEERGVRFPVLNVTGVRGSGKTTLIQRVMMPMFGQTNSKSYDAGTTRFVKLALLGSTNAIPIAFSEFRYESVEHFIRFVLLSYDTGHDPRGRSDQTTVDYPLTAPFTIDGEDLITDPAARERVVAVQLSSSTVAEGSDAYSAFQRLRSSLPKQFAGHYIQQLIAQANAKELDQVLTDARTSMFEAFPQPLPDRIRNNYTVVLFGTKLWCNAVGLPHIDPKLLADSIGLVYSVEAGRGRLLIDDFIEDVVNGCNRGTSTFKWHYSSEEKILYFQLSPAHSWWLVTRRRQGRGTLERSAMQAQLKEVSYSVDPQVVDNAWLYGVHLPSAVNGGLDIPNHLDTMEIHI